MVKKYLVGNFRGPRGIQGIQGEPGVQGIQGPQGERGPEGAPGVDVDKDPEVILGKLKSVDGSGSGLNADFLDDKDSSYFALADDMDILKKIEVHSYNNPAFKLFKWGKFVYLHINGWANAGRWSQEDYQWIGDIPTGFKPHPNLERVYATNLFNFEDDVRIRATSSGVIECRVQGSVTHNYYGFAVWITEE